MAPLKTLLNLRLYDLLAMRASGDDVHSHSHAISFLLLATKYEYISPRRFWSDCTLSVRLWRGRRLQLDHSISEGRGSSANRASRVGMAGDSK